ncbi:nucleotidyltransferase domain-containing protein [Methanothrix sp.]|uniref:nucleotidyltransferase domain-containing protein n=1 Tax=Methanothrix sp. TaxID=90426 RepID=UPI0025DCF0F4|nr:nucleotidyltransferase domain-containing protein [Methanothrix sp.]
MAEPSWEKRVLGVLLYGSWARGDAGPDSDIDLCLVAPEAEDRAGLWREFVSHLRSEKYDLRIFEILPLYEYFYPFRREWDDQKHRHTLSAGEVKELIAAARRARKGDGPEGMVET